MNPAYLASGGWIAAAVGAVSTLGIADLIDGAPRTAGELAQATGTSEAVLTKVLRVLINVGLFSEDAEGRFSNTADSAMLKSDHPQSMRYFCQLAAGDYQSWRGVPLATRPIAQLPRTSAAVSAVPPQTGSICFRRRPMR